MDKTFSVPCATLGTSPPPGIDTVKLWSLGIDIVAVTPEGTMKTTRPNVPWAPTRTPTGC
jgi:hypothetical protein